MRVRRAHATAASIRFVDALAAVAAWSKPDSDSFALDCEGPHPPRASAVRAPAMATHEIVCQRLTSSFLQRDVRPSLNVTPWQCNGALGVNSRQPARFTNFFGTGGADASEPLKSRTRSRTPCQTQNACQTA